VAYVVPAVGAAPDLADVRRVLAARLPDYMLPSSLVALDAFPLLPSGKVDRSALPAVEPRGTVYRAPRTLQETVLCSIVSELLERERVGLDDNFFALGGHSLLAMRLVGRVQMSLGVELSVREVFAAETVEQLCTTIHLLRLTSAGSIPAIEAVDREENYL
jgi:acyl carrier protein